MYLSSLYLEVEKTWSPLFLMGTEDRKVIHFSLHTVVKLAENLLHMFHAYTLNTALPLLNANSLPFR